MKGTVQMADPAKLAMVKQRAWFYPFVLPDGRQRVVTSPSRFRKSTTPGRDICTRSLPARSLIQRARPPLISRRTKVSSRCSWPGTLLRCGAMNCAGRKVEAARRSPRFSTSAMSLYRADLTRLPFDPDLVADFVLVFGLLYHLEDPIQVLRLASQLTRRHILIESQVFPYDISGAIEMAPLTSSARSTGVFAAHAPIVASSARAARPIARWCRRSTRCCSCRGKFGSSRSRRSPPSATTRTVPPQLAAS